MATATNWSLPKISPWRGKRKRKRPAEDNSPRRTGDDKPIRSHRRVKDHDFVGAPNGPNALPTRTPRASRMKTSGTARTQLEKRATRPLGQRVTPSSDRPGGKATTPAPMRPRGNWTDTPLRSERRPSTARAELARRSDERAARHPSRGRSKTMGQPKAARRELERRGAVSERNERDRQGVRERATAGQRATGRGRRAPAPLPGDSADLNARQRARGAARKGTEHDPRPGGGGQTHPFFAGGTKAAPRTQSWRKTSE